MSTTILGPLAVLGMVLAAVAVRRATRSSINVDTARKETQGPKKEIPEIVPLANFDWRTEEPLKIRPFRTKYNLTMAVEKCDVSEMIVMDKNYLERIELRKEIMQDHADLTIAATPRSAAAIKEFYEWLLSTFLPTRFPTMFQICPTDEKQAAYLLNLVDSEQYPLTMPESLTDALRIMGSVVDDDILFLLPSADGDGYVLDAFVTCFPNGFNMKQKFNLKLRDIHIPVPKYKQKLEQSMDRYFDRMEVGKWIKRSNWTITNTALFSVDGNHLYEGEEIPKFDFDEDKVKMRCERQVLHRLPETKAMCFTFKTYMYPIASLKEEGVGPDLIDAIDGLFKGNVPEMGFYKRAVQWGEPVKAYLRS